MIELFLIHTTESQVIAASHSSFTIAASRIMGFLIQSTPAYE